MEAAVSEAVTRFEKEYMGRGPLETRTYVVHDMLIVRLKGVLSKAEHGLVRSEHNGRGRDLVKQMKMELIENNRGALESAVRSIVRRKVRSMHSDISTATGERVIMFMLDRPPEFGFEHPYHEPAPAQ